MIDHFSKQADRLNQTSDSHTDRMPKLDSSTSRYSEQIACIRRISGAWVPALWVCAVVLVGARSIAGEGEEVRRTLFDRHDQSAVPGKEIITGTAELPPGTVIGWHVHSGDEAGYVLRVREVDVRIEESQRLLNSLSSGTRRAPRFGKASRFRARHARAPRNNGSASTPSNCRAPTTRHW
jgi:hypothetical protein